ncbi:MAG: DUF2132 domain-containing protein [Crocinitomicaceae bacterium]|nr:DUF2132 domain-containing protein [Crocinitomicaceae bacterium]
MSQDQPNNPLHGITLEMMLTYLVEKYGWEELGDRTKIRAFVINPSLKSGLNFIRKTPWAKTKIEELYLRSLKK